MKGELVVFHRAKRERGTCLRRRDWIVGRNAGGWRKRSSEETVRSCSFRLLLYYDNFFHTEIPNEPKNIRT